MLLGTLAAVPLPDFDVWYFVSIASRVLHTLSSSIIVGGTVYLWMVLAPGEGASDPASAEGRQFAGRRKVWSLMIAACTLFSLLSGLYNFWTIYVGNEKLPPLYHGLFGAKFLLAFVIFGLTAVYAGRSALAQRMRSAPGFWLGLILATSLAVFVLGAMLRSIPHIPKGLSPAPAATVEANG